MMPKEPGFDGTTVGQIDTPMCPTNVGRKNTPGVHDFGKAVGNASGKGGGDIKGPGVAGTAGPTTRAGSNKPGRY